MYKITRLLHLNDPTDPAALAAVLDEITTAAASTPARHHLIAATSPGARNGGDVLAHFHFHSQDEWTHWRDAIDAATHRPTIHRTESVEYTGGSTARTGEPAAQAWTGRRRSATAPSVYRTLLLRVDDSAPSTEVSRFEHALLQMPAHVPGILAWQLSRVTHTTGTTHWTHVWEQEFTDADALLGSYMNHPVHWGHVDRWFDPECPEQIVKDRVCHSFCAIPEPVITDTAATALSAARER